MAGPFSNLFAPNNTASLSVEHGLVKLLTSKGQTVLDHRVILANPRYFREGHVSNAARVASLMESVLPTMDGSFRQASAVVPGFQNRIRIMEFPKASGFNAGVIIGQEAARTMRVTAENYYLAWKRLRDNFDRSRWLVLAAHRRAIASIMETAQKANIKVTKLELRPFALARSVNQSEAIIAWAAPDGCDVVLVKNAVPVEHQSLFWGAELVEDAVLVDRLIEAVSRTLNNYNETSTDGPIPDDTPMYVCGSAVSRGSPLFDGGRGLSIAQQVAQSLKLPQGELRLPMDADEDFPANDMVVNVGLNLGSV